MWANFRLRNDEKYKQYKQYEDDPKLALKEVEDIIAKLKTAKRPEPLKLQYSEEESFYLLNYSIPTEVCSVMIRDFFDKLSKEESEFCAGIILEVASSSSGPNYQYRVTDGAQSAISVLPALLERFPKEKEKIKEMFGSLPHIGYWIMCMLPLLFITPLYFVAGSLMIILFGFLPVQIHSNMVLWIGLTAFGMSLYKKNYALPFVLSLFTLGVCIITYLFHTYDIASKLATIIPLLLAIGGITTFVGIKH